MAPYRSLSMQRSKDRPGRSPVAIKELAYAMQSIRRLYWRPRRQAAHRTSAGVRRRAFTVIELVIVIMITSIFAAVAAPAFLDSLLFHRVESAARRVKADIDYQRQRARLTSTAQSVTFAASTYTLSGAKSLNDPTQVYAVNLRQSPYSLDSATANFASTQVITFDGYGAPSSGGTVVLSAKTHQCTITVNGTTGTTTITSSHGNGGMAQVNGG
jgi:prepilin-type N-terminal cleavage/methylation domain-containing protein